MKRETIKLALASCGALTIFFTVAPIAMSAIGAAPTLALATGATLIMFALVAR